MIPELQRPGASSLANDQRALIGMMLWLSNSVGNGCELTPIGKLNLERLHGFIAPLYEALKIDDAFDVARAYYGAERLMRLIYGLNPESSIALPCSSEPQVLDLAVLQAVSLNLTTLESFVRDDEYTIEDFKEEMAKRAPQAN